MNDTLYIFDSLFQLDYINIIHVIKNFEDIDHSCSLTMFRHYRHHSLYIIKTRIILVEKMKTVSEKKNL